MNEDEGEVKKRVMCRAFFSNCDVFFIHKVGIFFKDFSLHFFSLNYQFSLSYLCYFSLYNIFLKFLRERGKNMLIF